MLSHQTCGLELGELETTDISKVFIVHKEALM